MKQAIQKTIEAQVRQLGVGDVSVTVTISPNIQFGDYTTAVALQLAKKLQRNPMEVAKQIVQGLDPRKIAATHEKSDQKASYTDASAYTQDGSMSVLQDVERVEIVPPGHINIFLTEAKLSTHMISLLKPEQSDLTVRNSSVGQAHQSRRITVEFTDPNPFKEFHIGHLYTNAIGESLSRILESVGHTVRRVNYQGDVGLHVAKSIWGMKKKMSEESLALQELAGRGLHERIQFLGQAYALGASEYESNTSAQDEMKDINYLVFVSAQDYWKKQTGWEPIVDYAIHITGKEANLPEIRELYIAGRAWSLEYFEEIYARLGTRFDGYYFESKVGEYGVQLVREHQKKGIFDESDGAIVFKGEQLGLHTRVFINSLGLPTYEAKELGLAPTKYMDWPYDLSVIITGKEIDEYFKVLIAAIRAINPELGEKTRHLSHGMVRLPDGKMSSRTGNVLTGEWLLEEVKLRCREILDQNKTNYSNEEKEDIAEKVTIAAVKYSLLRVSTPADIAFDIEKSLTFDGDSGPYLQYTYARCRSVMRKAKTVDVTGDVLLGQGAGLNLEEKAVARHLVYFQDIVADAAESFSPSKICTYLFQLAQLYNAFYSKHSVLGTAADGSGPDVRRIALTDATSRTLRKGLDLLGIGVIENM